MHRRLVRHLWDRKFNRQQQSISTKVQRIAYNAEHPELLEQQLLQQSEPQAVIVTGAMNNWKAMSWSISDLSQYGHLEIPVEVSHNGGDYRDQHAVSSHRHFEADVLLPLSAVLQGMQSKHNEQNLQKTVLYAAQVDLLSLIPVLEAGIEALPVKVMHDRLYKRNTWLGPAGTITPLHRDPYFNLFCQVWGSKYIRVYDSKHAQHLYPFSNPFLRNTSQVRVEKVDCNSFPGFCKVPFAECVLQPGEMLFIPKKFWHFVQAKAPSWSVSYWWT